MISEWNYLVITQKIKQIAQASLSEKNILNEIDNLQCLSVIIINNA